MTTIRLENVCDGDTPYACLHGRCVSQTTESRGNATVFLTTSNLTTCVCDAGYAHDTLFTRLENCAVPEWFEKFTFAMSLTCGVVALGIVARYYRGLRGSALYTVLALCFTILSNVNMAVVHLVDGYLSLPAYFFLVMTMVGFGILFRVFSDAVVLVTKHSFILASIKDGEQVDRALQAKIDSIRWLFTLQAMMIPFPWLVIFGITASLGAGNEPNYDVKAFNFMLMLAYPLMLLHNVIYFPSFLWLVSIFVRLIDASLRRRSIRMSMTSINIRASDLAEPGGTTNLIATTTTPNHIRSSLEGNDGNVVKKTTPGDDAMNLGSRLFDLKYRLNRFKYLAIFVLAPGELIFCIVVVPVYMLKLPAMYLVVFLGTAMVNLSTVILLLTIKGRKQYFEGDSRREREKRRGKGMMRGKPREDDFNDETGGRRMTGQNDLVRAYLEEELNNNDNEEQPSTADGVAMMRMRTSYATSSSFQ